MTVLETERLVLRRFRVEDADTLAAWNLDPRFYATLTLRPLSRAETEAAMARWEAHWDAHGFGLLALEDRASGALVGRSGVQYHPVWPDDPEVGWAVDPERWGRGLATEAGAACVRWAFGELDQTRLVSLCLPSNLASRRVMEKLGFRLHAERTSSAGPLLVHVLDRN